MKLQRPRDVRVMRFSSTVHVCLVPTRDELKTVMPDLYFKAEDFAFFKQDAVAELRELLTRLGISSKQAIALLYQPSDSEREEDEALVNRSALGGNGTSSNGDTTDRESDENEENGPSLSDVEDEEEGEDSGAAATSKGDDAQGIDDRRGKAKAKKTCAPSRQKPVGSKPEKKKETVQEILQSKMTEYEGPSLSDDEEEAEQYDKQIEAAIKLTFITGIKTGLRTDLIHTHTHTHTFSQPLKSSPNASPFPLFPPPFLRDRYRA